tara:strand:+ start:2414 stop:3043 length:630 start_codon:yes stop_codon:yes gene_type:complete
MANFFSASQEEQQEILLAFWNKFKYIIITSLLAIIVFIGSRDYFISSSNERDFLSATLYQKYMESYDEEIGEEILSLYPNEIYSDFVRLNEAKRSFENGDIDKAIELLEIVKNNNNSNANFNPLRAAAKTRLAKIYLENKNYENVISLLDDSDELTSSMYELKGDAENKLGRYSLSRTSYLLALQNSTNQASRALINMKISDLEGEDLD